MNDGREENDKPAKAARGPFAGARVLVVEDDLSISDVVSSALAQDGYVCTCAYSGTEARMLFESGSSFDIVLCDLMLPGLSGEELIARIRERCGVPILVASAKGEASDRVALLRMGGGRLCGQAFRFGRIAGAHRGVAASFCGVSAADLNRSLDVV